ncbi:MAG: PHP domain-containing protein [Oscillospiraceae bacterium]
MDNQLTALEQRLGASIADERLLALRELMALYNGGAFPKPVPTNYVNNHIHTIYSFSPYSPTSAAYTAWKTGLSTAGIMDHDSVAGIKEFLEAGEIIGMAVTGGFEVRCKMDKTPFAGKRINNTDQDSVAYLTCHGIPHQNIDKAQAWLTPYREKRELRNRKMVDNINALIRSGGLELDYDEDVRPISRAEEGGSVTERHLLFALSYKITEKYGRGPQVLDFLKSHLHIEVAGKNRDLLQNPDDSMYEYYLLGVLKGHMVEQFYIDATDECPDVMEYLRFCEEIGAISAYPYLGDVGDSVTGDKKTQKYEDDYLDELMAWLKKVNFRSITYMPTRNTPEQLARLITLCEEYGFFQISGEDINTPFQSFICAALDKPQFQHLIASTWALIGHELAASRDLSDGMFTEKTVGAMPGLIQRIDYFADYSRSLYQNHA